MWRLVCLLLLLPLSTQAAVPAPDAAGAVFNGATATNSVTVSITTNGANRVVIVHVRPVDSTAPAATVTSVSDGSGLTWKKRWAVANTMAACFSGNACYSDSEVWWACAAAQQTNDTVTANLSKTVNEVMIMGVSYFNTVSCTAPWDANSGLPTILSNTSGVDSSMIISGINTNSTESALMMFSGLSVNPVGPTTGCINGTGLSDVIEHATCFTAGGCNVDYNWITDTSFSQSSCAAAASVAAVSSLCGHTVVTHAWEMVMDALAGDVPTCGGGGGVTVTPQVEVNE